jgi:hypothetical protein
MPATTTIRGSGTSRSPPVSGQRKRDLRGRLKRGPEQGDEALDWVRRFGGHERLLQRLVRREQAALMRLSFVVVDERFVLIAVPGDAAVESEAYSARFVLRHLLVIEDVEVARAFSEVHGQLWKRAEPLPLLGRSCA